MDRVLRYVVCALAALSTSMVSVSIATAEQSPRQQFPVPRYSMEAFGCRTEAWFTASIKIDQEINDIDRARADLTVHTSLFLPVYGNRELGPEDQQRYDELNAIQRELFLLRAKMDKLPPCPGPVTIPVFNQGLLIGIYLIKTDGSNVMTERFIATDQITNSFRDRHDPIGFGVSVAYGFAPWKNNVVVAPFVSVDAPNTSVFHTFPNGSYLGTTSNVSGTLGVRMGPTLNGNLWLYGVAGVSVLNQTMKVNFIPVFSGADATVAGATIGAGFAWQPKTWQIANHPVSLFAEYQHTWWDSANFNAPAASPAFTYSFRREDDVVKFGVNIAFGGATPPPAPTYPVKALPPK